MHNNAAKKEEVEGEETPEKSKFASKRQLIFGDQVLCLTMVCIFALAWSNYSVCAKITSQ